MQKIQVSLKVDWIWGKSGTSNRKRMLQKKVFVLNLYHWTRWRVTSTCSILHKWSYVISVKALCRLHTSESSASKKHLQQKADRVQSNYSACIGEGHCPSSAVGSLTTWRSTRKPHHSARIFWNVPIFPRHFTETLVCAAWTAAWCVRYKQNEYLLPFYYRILPLRSCYCRSSSFWGLCTQEVIGHKCIKSQTEARPTRCVKCDMKKL